MWRCRGEHFPNLAGINGLATEQQLTQRRKGGRVVAGDRVEKRCGQKQSRNPLFFEKRRKPLRRECNVTRHAYKARSVQQSAPELECDRIKRESRRLSDAI